MVAKLYSNLDREGFAQKMSACFKPNAVSRIMRAYDLSRRWHEGQLRDCGRPYHDHPVEIALMAVNEFGARDARVVVLALLHDVIEDAHGFSESDRQLIVVEFGEQMLEYMELLTKRGGVEVFRAIREKSDAIPWLVKLIDALHNVRTRGACGEEKQKRILSRLEKVYIPLAQLYVSKFDREVGMLVLRAFFAERPAVSNE